MRMQAATRALLGAALLLLAARADAAAVTAGAPEKLVTASTDGGGECVRLFHSGGDVGCRSLSASDMAALYPVVSADVLAAFIAGAADQQEADKKYTLVMPEALLQYDALAGGLGRIAGAFVYPQADANVSFDSQTPQGQGTPDGPLNPFADAGVKWNPDGVGLIAQSLPFSVVLLKDEAAGEEFASRARKNLEGSAGATYTAFMNYYMGPEAMTARQCLEFTNIYNQRSPRCDPIGGQSSWAVRGDTSAEETVLAMASMDSNGLSHVLAPGANTGASGVVALLAAAEALRALDDGVFGKKLVFAAFQADKFGFAGSRKLLADLKRFADDPAGACAFPVSGSQSPFGENLCTNPMLSNVEFPSHLSLANISFAIAVDQVGILPASGNLSVHLNPHANDSAELLDALVNAPSGAGVVAQGSVANALPPTPLTSFVHGDEYGRRELVGAVLAGYDDEFSGSGVYNSRHDVLEAVDAAAVALAAQVLAEGLYTLAAANASTADMAKIQVNATLVADMLACLSSDWHCELMQAYSTPIVATMIDYLSLTDSSWPSYSVPSTLYPGVLDSDRSMLVKTADASYHSLYNESWAEDTDRVHLFPNAYEVFTRAFLASAMLPTSEAETATTCAKSQTCGDSSGAGRECVYPGVCADQRAYFHEASPPGLARTTTALLYDVVNDSLPIWTEPKWDSDVGSYAFPDPGKWIGWISLLAGAAVTAVAVALSKMLLASVHKMKLM